MVPVAEDDRVSRLSSEKFLLFKRHVSRYYLQQIRSTKTYGILIVNEPKNEIPHYIGANTFAEVAVAFNACKRIFILYDLYETYLDELLSWGAIALHGDLNSLVKTYRQTEGAVQLSLFDEPVTSMDDAWQPTLSRARQAI